eukprot:GILK01004514.1.p1 GENE.GILK01004514.1~~GILK01004514.1.p1  ORF type:complete len:808 (+),score=130.58 GILK01004514.1:38-2425(+)
MAATVAKHKTKKGGKPPETVEWTSWGYGPGSKRGGTAPSDAAWERDMKKILSGVTSAPMKLSTRPTTTVRMPTLGDLNVLLKDTHIRDVHVPLSARSHVSDHANFRDNSSGAISPRFRNTPGTVFTKIQNTRPPCRQKQPHEALQLDDMHARYAFVNEKEARVPTAVAACVEPSPRPPSRHKDPPKALGLDLPPRPHTPPNSLDRSMEPFNGFEDVLASRKSLSSISTSSQEDIHASKRPVVNRRSAWGGGGGVGSDWSTVDSSISAEPLLSARRRGCYASPDPLISPSNNASTNAAANSSSNAANVTNTNATSNTNYSVAVGNASIHSNGMNLTMHTHINSHHGSHHGGVGMSGGGGMGGTTTQMSSSQSQLPAAHVWTGQQPLHMTSSNRSLNQLAQLPTKSSSSSVSMNHAGTMQPVQQPLKSDLRYTRAKSAKNTSSASRYINSDDEPSADEELIFVNDGWRLRPFKDKNVKGIDVFSKDRDRDRDRDRGEDRVELSVGFSVVIDMLIAARKPLIGHNMLLDLAYLYGQFIQPLPRCLTDFKRQIHELFPVIWDTKLIVHAAKLDKLFSRTSLEHLFDECESHPELMELCSFEHAEGFDRYEGQSLAHEAGYDAFMTGCIFAYICKYLTHKTHPPTSDTPTPGDLQVLESYKNQINMIRAAQHSLHLTEEDPEPPFSDVIYVGWSANEFTCAKQVADVFAAFGNVEVRMDHPRGAFVRIRQEPIQDEPTESCQLEEGEGMEQKDPESVPQVNIESIRESLKSSYPGIVITSAVEANSKPLLVPCCVLRPDV